MTTKPKTKAPKTFAEAAALCQWTDAERRMFAPLHKATSRKGKPGKRGRGSRKP